MKKVIFCLSALLFYAVTLHSQTKLGKAEDSLKEDDKPGSRSSTQNDIGDYDESFLGFLGYYVMEAVMVLTYYTLIESPSEQGNNASMADITKYPYYFSNRGNYDYDTDNGENSFFRVDLTSRYLSENNNLKGMHVNMDMRFLKRIGVELDYLQLWENNPNFGKDNLALYSLLAKYYRIRTEKFDLHWGVGATYVDGSVDEFGFTYGLGAELFFAKPLSLEINYSQAFLNHETINKFNGLLNYHMKQFKFIGGYEHIRIGSQNFSMPTLGVGVFF